METWSEARKPDHDIGRAYGITSHNDRVVSPDGSFEQKDGGTVYASPSGQSSDTAVHAVTKDLPFESKNSIV